MNAREAAAGKIGELVKAGHLPPTQLLATTAEETYFSQGTGLRADDISRNVDGDTVMWIASMTKAITATAAMQLVERGELSLDAPAADLLPELATVPVLEGFDAAGQPRLRAMKGHITLRHLLTHTAGFGYDAWSDEISKYCKATDTPGTGSRDRRSLTTPLLFDPGTNWIYSIAIDWAGLMVEAASGQSLGNFMADNIFEPLGMMSTAFRLQGDMADRLTPLHFRREKEALSEVPNAVIENPADFDMGGGGLLSTANDYARFIRMILNKGTAPNGQKILQPDTVAEMSRNQMGDVRVQPLTSYAPVSRDVDIFPGIEKTWGLSFLINETQAPTGRSAGSLAWAGLTNCYFWIDPVKNIGGIYMSQLFPFIDIVAYPQFEAFETAIYRDL